MGKMSIGSSKMPPVKSKSQSKVETSPSIDTMLTQTIKAEPIIEHHHHTKHMTVHMETVKTKDLRTRNYAKAIRKKMDFLQKTTNYKISLTNQALLDINTTLNEVASRKPVEKQVLTETKIIEYKLDKRVIIAMVITTVLNLALILLK